VTNDGTKFIDTDAFLHRGHDDIDAGVGGTYFVGGLLRIDLGRAISRCFGEYDNGLGASIATDSGAPLNATVLHWSIEPADQQHLVDVGSELLFAVAVSISTTQKRSPREDGNDFATFKRDPIANSGLWFEPKCEHHGFGSVRQRKYKRNAVMLKNSSGFSALESRSESFRPRWIPTEWNQRFK
jgi:hypothetical protein